MSGGFYKRRRGILEHLEAGRLNLLDLGVHDLLCLKANQVVGNGSIFPPGVVITSAAAIAGVCSAQYTGERAIRRSLERLERIGFIKRWQAPGRRGNYPILINRFAVRDLSGTEFLVNAENTADWNHPVLESAVDAPRSVRDLSADNKEVKNKNIYISSEPDGSDLSTKSPSAEKTAAMMAIVRRVWDYYTVKLAKNPVAYEFTPTRKQKGRKRLDESLKKTGGDLAKAERLMMLAVDALEATDWNMGRDPKTCGRKFDSWEKHLFRSQEQFESWLEIAQSLPR